MLNDKDIDWEGNCIFEGKNVVGFKINLPTNHRHMKPIPYSERALNDAKIALQTLEGIMQPATREQIAIAIKKLSLFFGMSKMSPNESSSFLADYYYDLKKYPIKLIEEACAAYRMLPEGNDFMPRSGKLITLMAEKYSKMQFMKIRINKILGTYIAPEHKQNKETSLSEALDKLMTSNSRM